ncbi:MAG: hypothetical protein CM15mP62_17010 [Rhodospirillaceae bacterium]|nr:MAG: hypothetical protein CM15mP62_17010 [Rhodospirillaceae bacterium]
MSFLSGTDTWSEEICNTPLISSYWLKSIFSFHTKLSLHPLGGFPSLLYKGGLQLVSSPHKVAGGILFLLSPIQLLATLNHLRVACRWVTKAGIVGCYSFHSKQFWGLVWLTNCIWHKYNWCLKSFRAMDRHNTNLVRAVSFHITLNFMIAV